MIKKLSLLSLFTLLPASFYYAQTTVYAYLKDTAGKPVERAEVDLKDSENDVTADKIGYFQFVDMQPGHYQITITKFNYETKVFEFDVTEGEKRKDLGTITLYPTFNLADQGLTVIDLENEDDESQNSTVGLLQSSRDAFDRAAAFELGAYWFRPRGLDNRYSDVLFNGIPMSKNDNGRVEFSNWGGLNDITRYPYESVQNITPSDYTFGNLGGVVYYNTRASSFRKGFSLAYSATNRSYNNRLMATYSTGMSASGWAFTFSGSRRWAEEGKIEGTYQDSYAYFAAIEKKFSDKHALNLTAFGAPTYRAGNSPNTQEVYDLLGKDYNSYWGWQNGEKRNERIRKTFEPVFQLSHYWNLSKKSKLNTTLSYQFGTDKRGRLDWFNAASPSPTYYRNLPSYVYAPTTYETSLGGIEVTDAERAIYDPVYEQSYNNWRNGTINRQIDWGALYNANYNANQQEKGAAYYTVQDVNADKTFNFGTHFDTQLNSNWRLNINFNYQNFQSDNYRRLNDLLGGMYAQNLDDFDYTGGGTYGQYNVDSDEVKVYEGDRMEYNYMLYRDSYSGNISTNVKLNRWDITGSVYLNYSESQRDGKYRHYLYLDSSKGKSDLFTSWDFGLKGRVEYKIDGKNFLVYDGAYFSIAPTLDEIFPNARVTNAITPNLKSQIINSNDLSFIHRGQILKLRLSGYYTTVENATEVSRYYAEGVSSFVDVNNPQASTTSENAFIAEIVSGINKEYLGGELGAEVKVTPTLSLNAVASVGQFTYTNNPNVSLMSDRFQGVSDRGSAYLKNYKVAGTPQQGYSLGIRYNSPKYWWIGATGNLIAGNYLDISALPRTSNFIYVPGSTITYPGLTEDLVRDLLRQKHWDDEFMLNANAGKSFLFGKYRVGLSISVNNILNNRDYVTGGFEQGRNANFQSAMQDANRPISIFGPKLWYDRGRTYYANVYLRF